MYSRNEEAQIIKDMSASIYNKEKTYTEEELSKDPIWIEASKAVYKKLNGYELMGSEQEIAKQGLDIMGEFNYNMTLGTAGQTIQMEDADDYTKTAFYYMMDAYDKKDISMAGAERALKEMALDPLNYAMLFGTAGVGFFGKQAAGTAAKSTLKETLRQAATRYVGSAVAVGATEGAIYTGADDYARQVAGIRAGIQEKYDPIRGAIATGVGGAVGGGLGYVAEKGVKAVGKGISNVIESGEEEMMKAAGGGTPPVVDDVPISMKDTKVVDESTGEPLTVFHGSSEKFDKFDKDKIGKNFRESEGGGFFFTKKERSAKNYARLATGDKSNGYLYNVNLDIKNPYVISTNSDYYTPADRYDLMSSELMREARLAGNDGIIIKGTNNDDLYVAFEPEQIHIKDVKGDMAGGGTPPVINNTLTDDNVLGGSYLKSKEGVPKGKTIYHPLRDKNYIYNEEEDKMYFKAGDKWMDMPNEDMKNDIRFINKNGVKAFENKQRELDANIEESRRIEQEQYEKSKNDPNAWKDQHKAPTRTDDGSTSSIDNLIGVYPDDIYSENAARYYGHGDKTMDKESIDILTKIKGKPDATVTIYRAVPKDIKDVGISKGDWVTISKKYAINHGVSRFDGKYKILSKKVKAEDIITDGNSIHEQGYDPKGN